MGVKTRKANRKLWARTEVAIVHFVHRPKPWEAALAQPTAELWKLAERYNIEPLVRRALIAMDCDGLLRKLAKRHNIEPVARFPLV
jgi:lipopolysaccharide biosynthesis glycosyltransferase